MKKETKVILGGAGIIGGFSTFMFIGMLIVAVIAGLCWDYMFGKWLPYMDLEHNVPMWACMLMGFVPVLGQLSIPGWIVTLILFSFILV
jgi:hypothetical protein